MSRRTWFYIHNIKQKLEKVDTHKEVIEAIKTHYLKQKPKIIPTQLIPLT